MAMMRNICLVFLLLLAHCSHHDDNQDVNEESLVWIPRPSQEWSVATPESSNMDEDMLHQAYIQASQSPHMKSLLVIRYGNLVGESYFRDLEQDDIHDVMSVTKTIIAMLIGVAIEEGYLSGPEETIESYFVNQYPDLELEKWSITIGHLLTMTSGFEWNESSGTEYINWANSSDPIATVLNRPLVSVPGEHFTYNSGAVHLLSVILTKATGKETLDFAEEFLFRPLGFGHVYWEKLALGYYNGGSGLDIRPRDMAKLGKLLLDQGMWNGREILPPSWIQQAMHPSRQSSGTYGPLAQIDYGYLWWLAEARDNPIQLAWGWGGQFIATFPQKDLVVITTSDWNVDVTIANNQEVANLELMINHILPAAL